MKREISMHKDHKGRFVASYEMSDGSAHHRVLYAVELDAAKNEARKYRDFLQIEEQRRIDKEKYKELTEKMKHGMLEREDYIFITRFEYGKMLSENDVNSFACILHCNHRHILSKNK